MRVAIPAVWTILLSTPTLHTPALMAQQPAPSTAPVVFAEGIVSTGHEFTVTFASDGHTVYFTRFDTESRRNHLMQSVKGTGGWEAATSLPFGNAAWSDLDPALSPDGTWLYFISTRPRPNGDTTTNMDLWVVKRSVSGWGEPEWLEELASPGKEGAPTVDRNGRLCFFSDRDGGANQNAIYCAGRTSRGYQSPAKANANINAGPSDTSPWLAPDGKTMLFYSTRSGGQGAADLYLSRKRNSDWLPAVNLGPLVNTTEFEYNPSVSPDGKTLYFGRKGRIWEIPLAALDPKVVSSRWFQ